jgi:hypothetical protein
MEKVYRNFIDKRKIWFSAILIVIILVVCPAIFSVGDIKSMGGINNYLIFLGILTTLAFLFFLAFAFSSRIYDYLTEGISIDSEQIVKIPKKTVLDLPKPNSYINSWSDGNNGGDPQSIQFSISNIREVFWLKDKRDKDEFLRIQNSTGNSFTSPNIKYDWMRDIDRAVCITFKEPIDVYSFQNDNIQKGMFLKTRSLQKDITAQKITKIYFSVLNPEEFVSDVKKIIKTNKINNKNI